MSVHIEVCLSEKAYRELNEIDDMYTTEELVQRAVNAYVVATLVEGYQE